uniref:Glutaredoxin domain-containing protein n=1 Tax=viral metagenome TaxID=1070528 RepID=A0A6C0HGI1_9ZZZZ
MSSILYYSNFCDNCKVLLQILSKSNIKNDIHFINIDKRVKKNNGATYIVLENAQEILLPPTVTKVPALLLLDRNHHVLFGNDINRHLEPKHVAQTNNIVQTNGEPLAFSMAGGSFGVVSDNYSFLDQDADSLSAKGNGGMRQQHHYASLDGQGMIETPPDTYTPDKVGQVSMEQLQQKRNAEVTGKRQ